jgi:hypothetical protein
MLCMMRLYGYCTPWQNQPRAMPGYRRRNKMEANNQIQMFIEAKGPDFVVEACIEKALKASAHGTMPGKVKPKLIEATKSNGGTNSKPDIKVRAPKHPRTPKPKKAKSPGESKGKTVVTSKVLNAFPPPDHTITAASLAEKLGLEAPNVRQGLRALCDEGKIQKLGGGKGTTYQRVQE